MPGDTKQYRITGVHQYKLEFHIEIPVDVTDVDPKTVRAAATAQVREYIDSLSVEHLNQARAHRVLGGTSEKTGERVIVEEIE